jgi:copper chaperone CopZ
MSEVRLTVGGMSCGGCQGAVKTALEAVEGVSSVAVELDPGSAVVKGTASAAALIAAVQAVGKRAAVGKTASLAKGASRDFEGDVMLLGWIALGIFLATHLGGEPGDHNKICWAQFVRGSFAEAELCWRRGGTDGTSLLERGEQGASRWRSPEEPAGSLLSALLQPTSTMAPICWWFVLTNISFYNALLLSRVHRDASASAAAPTPEPELAIKETADEAWLRLRRSREAREAAVDVSSQATPFYFSFFSTKLHQNH